MSRFVYQKTGHDIGLLTLTPDPDFLFDVQMAAAINERRAAPLLDMASDSRLSNEKRERALLALLRFDSNDQWIQAFLNELPKGGLYGLYDEKSTAIDQLFAEIRANNGIHQKLVRDYAEVVFGFLLQSKNMHIKEKAFRWMNDSIPEEAISLVAERLEREKDPELQKQIEEVLWGIKKIPNPEKVKPVLAKFYKAPPWPAVRFPIAVILARLGTKGIKSFLENDPEVRNLSNEQKIKVALAISGEPYPQNLAEKVTVTDENRQQRIQARQAQYAYVVKKQQELFEEEQLRESLISKETALNKAIEKETRNEEKNNLGHEIKPIEPNETSVISHKNVESKPVVNKNIDNKTVEKELLQDEIAAENNTVPVESNQKPDTQSAIEHKESPVSPSTIEATKNEPKDMQVASLPVVTKPEIPILPLPPPNVQREKNTDSNMLSVDYVFEVKDNFAPVFSEAGATDPTADILTKGSKGQATFKVIIGSDIWYQIKSKSIKGWVKASAINIYDLSPDENANVPKKIIAEAEGAKRQESTYFQPNSDGIIAHKEPSESSASVGKLVDGISYLAIESKKVSADRWFYLEVSDGINGWVLGVDLQLADTLQPSQLNKSDSDLSLRGKKSAFAADWVEATVKGVGVYDKPTIIAREVSKISPIKHYRVIDHSEGGGNEWYKIDLGKKKEGWVQAMDVSLRNTEK